MGYIFLILPQIILWMVIPMVLYFKRLKNNQNNIKNNTLIGIVSIILYTIVLYLAISGIYGYYASGIPNTTSDLCVNTGGWTYSCKFNDKIAFIALTLMLVVSIIYYKLCERQIFKLAGKSQFIILLLYLIFSVITSFILLVLFGGLFISIDYNSQFLELFRIIVICLPMSLFGLSVYLKLLLQKIKKRSV